MAESVRLVMPFGLPVRGFSNRRGSMEDDRIGNDSDAILRLIGVISVRQCRRSYYSPLTWLKSTTSCDRLVGLHLIEVLLSPGDWMSSPVVDYGSGKVVSTPQYPWDTYAPDFGRVRFAAVFC
jgi:hypothetical protein